jgi:hypothetical protein
VYYIGEGMNGISAGGNLVFLMADCMVHGDRCMHSCMHFHMQPFRSLESNVTIADAGRRLNSNGN